MITFEIVLNGIKQTVAGIHGSGVLSAIVHLKQDLQERDLRLLLGPNAGELPIHGTSLVVIAVDRASLLNLRIFDGNGNMVEDTTEAELSQKIDQINALKEKLEELKGQGDLARDQKRVIVAMVESLVDQKPEGHVVVDVGALEDLPGRVRRNLDWKSLALNQGDELLIRIKKAETFDPPDRERVEHPSDVMKRKSEYLKHLQEEVRLEGEKHS